MRTVLASLVAVGLWSTALAQSRVPGDEFGPTDNMTSIGTQVSPTHDVGTPDTEITDEGALTPVSPRVPDLDVPAEPGPRGAFEPGEPTPDRPGNPDQPVAPRQQQPAMP